MKGRDLKPKMMVRGTGEISNFGPVLIMEVDTEGVSRFYKRPNLHFIDMSDSYWGAYSCTFNTENEYEEIEAIGSDEYKEEVKHIAKVIEEHLADKNKELDFVKSCL